SEPSHDTSEPQPSPVERLTALLEVLLCSDYPTQFALGATFAALGVRPFASNGQLLVGYVVGLSLADTALLIGLIVFFLRAHGERPRTVLLGARPIGRESAIGLLMTCVALVIGIGILAAIQVFAPSLHT